MEQGKKMGMEDERFPQFKREPKPNVTTNGQFIADGNSIHPSAMNVIVTGARNDVGANTQNISILNSSGCIVAPGVHGVTLLHSSGITVVDDDVVIIHNTIVPAISKKTYIALVTQTSTNAPTLNILVNTLGTINASYSTNGTYTITGTGLFTVNKTTITIGGHLGTSTVDCAFIQASDLALDSFTLFTYDFNTVATNDVLLNTMLMIEVYN